MRLRTIISIAVISLIAIGILPFTGRFWSGLWIELSKPSQYECVESHTESEYKYGPMLKTDGTMGYGMRWEYNTICDKRIINPDWVEWNKEHGKSNG